MKDLDELKDDLDPAEYEESRNETINQINEFSGSLDKMASGDITLVDDIGKAQLAIQSAVREAFKSTEVMQIFERKESGAMRRRLAELEEAFKLGRLAEHLFTDQKREILESLDKLGDELCCTEMQFLTEVSNLNIL